MADDIAERVEALEKTVAALWKCIDELYAKHGQKSPRWTYNGRRDMVKHMRRRLAS